MHPSNLITKHHRFVAIVICLLLTFNFTFAMAAEQKQYFSEFTREDQIQIERQRAFVHDLAERLAFPTVFRGTRLDLAVLQRIIDAKAIPSTKTWELQSLGIMLGDVFAHENGLRWVIVEDEYGRDPALRYKNTSNLVFPLTMISKRIEDGKTVDLQPLFDGVSDHVDQFTE